MTSAAIGNKMMQTYSIRLLHGFGFSNGWAELAPKKPPPFVPSCLGATIAATGPRAISCVFAAPASVVAHRVGFDRGRVGLACIVIGIPQAISITATITDSGRKRYITPRHIST